MPRQALRKWFQTSLGASFLNVEKLYMGQVISNLFGYHIVQLGCTDYKGLLENSRISHKLITQLEEDGEQNCGSSCVHSADALSLATESIDVLVLPHVLEYTENPHQLLREIDRVLIGEGHVVISAFNPFSLWGLWRLFLAWRGRAPWHGHFYRLFRVKDWLNLLDFEVIRCAYYFYRPPLQKESILEKLGFLENLGRYCWPIFSGAYIIVAKKRVIPLTPVKHQWLDRRKNIASGIVEPTARSYDTSHD
jgi:SAM-dependent methyltransferase